MMEKEIYNFIMKKYEEKDLGSSATREIMDLDIYDDLEFDSIDVVDLISYIENKYDCAYEKIAYGITNYSIVSAFISYCEKELT